MPSKLSTPILWNLLVMMLQTLIAFGYGCAQKLS